MKKIKVKRNKAIYLGLAISDISKTLKCEFWYDYIKLKYGNNAKLSYKGTDSFIFHVKTEYFYEDIAGDTSGYNFKRLMGKNKKELGKFKDELCGGIMTEFVALRPKTYLYLDDDGAEKKAKGTKKCVTERKLKFIDYKKCLLNDETILKSQQRTRSEAHNVYTEEVNKIALRSNDDKRLQTFDRITTYPYGISAGRVYKTELLEYFKYK